MPLPDQTSCDPGCAVASSAEALNRSCYCIGVDADAVRLRLESDLAQQGLAAELLQTHPHLFASQPVFLSQDQLRRMRGVIEAVERVVALPAFIQAALAWAPQVASFDPHSRGGLLGYDFHLSDAGPQLIEINTNPGGVLLNVLLAAAQQSCCQATTDFTVAQAGAHDTAQAIFGVLAQEWRMQRGAAPLATVAIVDTDPSQQYLYPEFLLYQKLLERNGVTAIVCDPRELERQDGTLRWQGRNIDFVYNRLTDFALADPALAVLRTSYLAGEVVVSPHPRAHALYADKRNLSLLCDAQALRASGADEETIAMLVAGIPRTEILSAENHDRMWARRRELFFKPAAGFGSKATYRGDKLTTRVWADICSGNYVAQALVMPSLRATGSSEASATLKVDVRNFAYDGTPLLVAARLYQGQTTNFRTPGGGFAPVLTSRAP